MTLDVHPWLLLEVPTVEVPDPDLERSRVEVSVDLGLLALLDPLEPEDVDPRDMVRGL